jgi:glucose/arabinose dehydrogenase
MVKRLVMTCLGIAAMTLTPAAQEKPAAPGTAEAKPPAAAQARPPAAAPAADVRRRNVNIEVAITDQTGAADPVKKVVAMIVADRQMGSVRSSGSLVDTASGPVGTPPVAVDGRPLILNVDANPVVHSDGSILLSLTLEYVPRPEAGEKNAGRAQLNERMTVTLESGKPLVVSRSADPGSSRKIAVEVTATVMK